MSPSSASSSSLSPTTRSRTLFFISIRDSRARSTRFSRSSATYDEPYAAGDESEGLISSNSKHVAVDMDLPPKWVDISEQVEEILTNVQVKVAALEKLHAKHVLPGFADRTSEEKEIEAATTDITKDFRRCHSLIQRIGNEQDHAFPPSSRRAKHEVLAAKNMQRGLAARLQECSASFRKKQRVYLEKLQGHAIKNQDLLIASGAISSKGSEGLTAVDEDIEAAHQSQAQVLEHNLAFDARARDKELTEIANSIASLAELFKDLSVLVIDQGTLLDSVEYNIEQTSVNVAEAVKELNIATRYQKNTGRRKCIILLLLIIFGLILVLIFKPRRQSSSPDLTLPVPSSNAFSPVYPHPRTVFRL